MRLNILAFACGILLLQMQAQLPTLGVFAALFALLVTVAVLSLRYPHRLLALVWPLCCVLGGVLWAGGMAHQRLSEQLPEVWESKDIQIVGVIASLPQHFERGERFEFDVESVQTSGAKVPQRIMLSWYRNWDEPDERDEIVKNQEVHPGERWHLTVRLKRPHGHANPFGFDYEAWLFERSIRATGSIRSSDDNQRLQPFVLSPAYAVQRMREMIRQRFVAALPEAPYLGVLIALTVGDQRAIPNSQWLTFNRTGVTHLISISGLHVTMLAALFASLTNWLWRRSERLMLRLPAQKAAIVAGWLAALTYALLAGFEVPAQRTLYMLTVLMLALWSGRNFGVSRTLLLALLAVLVLDPWAVLSIGFWLSFGAVALLLLVGTSRLGKTRGWRLMLTQWGMTQWAVTVGSLPLLLFFFQQFSLVSPLANALAIPLVSFVITPLALLFAVVPWAPLLHFDHWLMVQLMGLLEGLAVWPVWQQVAPPLWASLMAMLGVVWLLLPRGFPARWLGLCLMLPALFGSSQRPLAGEAWVDVLDVGQGLSVVVQTAEHVLLYDTGPFYNAESNAGLRVVVPFLRASGIRHIDTLIVSHRDKDHAGGLNAVRSSLPVEQLLSSFDGIGGDKCAAGQHWEWDGIHFQILHPEVDDYARNTKKSNNLSCVLRLSNPSASVLLTADIEAADEKALRRRAPELLASTVLVVPHHGGSGSSTPAFIEAVGARDVIFSAGYRNRFKHPRPNVLERYAASRQWRTDQDGAIRLVLDGVTEPSAWRKERRRYWHGQ